MAIVGYVMVSEGRVGALAVESNVSAMALYQAKSASGQMVGRPSNSLQEQKRVVEAMLGVAKRIIWTEVYDANTGVTYYQATDTP